MEGEGAGRDTCGMLRGRTRGPIQVVPISFKKRGNREEETVGIRNHQQL
jgi:hypothetical protein